MQQSNIDILARNMGLSPYQANVLKSNYDEYDIRGLVKRGHALYVPRRAHGPIVWRMISRLRGVRGDLIGQQKTLLRRRRGIKLYGGGFYSVNVGRRKLYGDDSGAPFTRTANRNI